jgi:hypothetical protein
MVVIMVMVVQPAGNGRPCHIANRSACDGADRAADNGAGPRPHQSFIEPFSGRRGAPGERNPDKERQYK